MKITFKDFVAHCYYICISGVAVSAGLLFLFWDYGETTANGRVLLALSAICGLASCIGTITLVASMMMFKWPKESEWLDNSFGLGAILYGLWLLAKIIVPALFLQ